MSKLWLSYFLIAKIQPFIFIGLLWLSQETGVPAGCCLRESPHLGWLPSLPSWRGRMAGREESPGQGWSSLPDAGRGLEASSCTSSPGGS